MKTILLLLAASLTCTAGLRKGPHSYAVTSRDGDFIFVMNAGPEGKEHAEGFGICYKVLEGGKFKEMWRTTGWWSQWVQLSWDGKHLARVGCWESGDQDDVAFSKSLALALYQEGRLLKEHPISDLLTNPKKVWPTTAGYRWWGASAPGFRSWKGDYFLRTTEGIEFRFSLETGVATLEKKAERNSDAEQDPGGKRD